MSGVATLQVVLFRRHSRLKQAFEKEARQKGIRLNYLNISEINRADLVVGALGKIATCELDTMMIPKYRRRAILMIQPGRSWNIFARQRCEEMAIPDNSDEYADQIRDLGYPHVMISQDTGSLVRWGVEFIIENFNIPQL